MINFEKLEMVGNAVYGLGIHLQKTRDFGITEEYEFTSVFLDTIHMSPSPDQLYDISVERESAVRKAPPLSTTESDNETEVSSPSESSTSEGTEDTSTLDACLSETSSIDSPRGNSRGLPMFHSVLLDPDVDALRARVVAKIAAQEEKLSDTLQQLEKLKKKDKRRAALEAQYQYQQEYLTAIKSDLLSLVNKHDRAATEQQRNQTRKEQMRDLDSDGEEGCDFIEYEDWSDTEIACDEEEIIYVDKSDDEGEELIEYEEHME